MDHTSPLKKRLLSTPQQCTGWRVGASLRFPFPLSHTSTTPSCSSWLWRGSKRLTGECRPFQRDIQTDNTGDWFKHGFTVYSERPLTVCVLYVLVWSQGWISPNVRSWVWLSRRTTILTRLCPGSSVISSLRERSKRWICEIVMHSTDTLSSLSDLLVSPLSYCMCLSAVCNFSRWALSLWTCTVTWCPFMTWSLWRRSQTLTWTSTCGMRLTSAGFSHLGSNLLTQSHLHCWYTSGAKVRDNAALCC